MKTYYFFILFTLITVQEACGQKNNETILRIRQDFSTINKDSTLRIITLDAEDFLDNTPDGVAELKGFYKNGQLVKLIEWIGLSNGNRIREFYFKNEVLFFVYEKFESFAPTEEGLDKTSTRTSYEGRFYISKDKLVDKKVTGKMPVHQPESTLAMLKSDAEEYRIKLSSIK